MTINNSNEFIKLLKAHPDHFYLIHYSCQNLNDDNEGLSPRITSIAVMHYSSEQSVSFSTHAIAEELGKSRDEVIQSFNEVERALLESFFRFVSGRRENYWVHWNMRNSTYGFEHLEHRYKVLGGRDASIIPVERRVNLNDMIADRYGSDYAPHQKMPNLMAMNGGRPKHFLSGEEEVQAFKNCEYMKMHMSTQAKVSFFHRAMSLMVKGQLKTVGRGFGARLDRLFEARWVKAIGLFATIITIGVGCWQTYLWWSEWSYEEASPSTPS